MPIGAKLYENSSDEEAKDSPDEAGSEDKKEDEPIEGEVVEDKE